MPKECTEYDLCETCWLNEDKRNIRSCMRDDSGISQMHWFAAEEFTSRQTAQRLKSKSFFAALLREMFVCFSNRPYIGTYFDQQFNWKTYEQVNQEITVRTNN
jgi:hypothetical protein